MTGVFEEPRIAAREPLDPAVGRAAFAFGGKADPLNADTLDSAHLVCSPDDFDAIRDA